MSTLVSVILLVLFVAAAVVVFINLTGDPGIDYWDLDGSNTPEPSKLDVFRNYPVFFNAVAVLLGTVVAYRLLR